MKRKYQKAFGRTVKKAAGAALGYAFKHKRRGSITKTKTTTPKRKSFNGTKGTYDKNKFTIVCKKLRPKTASGVIRNLQSHTRFVSSLAGTQSVETIICLGTRQQWVTDSGPTYAVFENYKAHFSLNYNATMGGTPLFPTVLSPKQQKLALLKYEVDLEIWNAESNNCHLSLHWVQCLSDQDDLPELVWQADMLNESLGTATHMATSAAGTTGAGTWGLMQTDDIGCTPPQKGKLWKRFFKTLKVQNFHLASAEARHVKATFVMNQMVKSDALAQTLKTFQKKAGSICCLAVVRGGMVSDVTGGADTPTYGIAKVGVIAQCATSIAGCPDNKGSFNLAVGAANFPGGSIATNQRIIDENDAAVVPKYA